MFTVYIVDDDRNLCRCLEQLIPWKEYGYYTPLVCHPGRRSTGKNETETSGIAGLPT